MVRGGLGELVQWAQQGVRGEITLVVGGATAQGAAARTLTLEEAAGQAVALAAKGMRLKDAAAVIAEKAGLTRREVYEAALRLPRE